MFSIVAASVSLGVVLDEQQVMAKAYFVYALGVCALSVQMYYHYGMGATCYGTFNLSVVNLECIDAWFYKHWCQIVLGYGKDGSYIGVGWYYHFVAIVQSAHLLISPQDEHKGVKSVAATYTIACADITGIFLGECLVLVALQIPSAIHNTLYGSIDFIGMHRRHSL